jgi:hypothetical protein
MIFFFQTLLQFAILKGAGDIVEILLRNGADINQKDVRFTSVGEADVLETLNSKSDRKRARELERERKRERERQRHREREREENLMLNSNFLTIEMTSCQKKQVCISVFFSSHTLLFSFFSLICLCPFFFHRSLNCLIDL